VEANTNTLHQLTLTHITGKYHDILNNKINYLHGRLVIFIKLMRIRGGFERARVAWS